MSAQQPIPGLIAGIVGAGLIYAAIKDKNVVYVFRYALSGKNPADAPATGKTPGKPKPPPIMQGNKTPGTTNPDGTGGQYSDLLPNLGGGSPQYTNPGGGGFSGGLTYSSYTGGSDPTLA